MRIELPTARWRALLSKASRGSSNNKMLPLTSFIMIELKNNTLTLGTTDGINTMFVYEHSVPGEDFYAVVNAEVFNKLVMKMTSTNIALTVMSDKVKVEGNGVYNLEIPLNEEGNPVVFPIPNVEVTDEFLIGSFTKSALKSILMTNKASLSTSLDGIPCYTGYYVGEEVVTSDGTKICYNDINISSVPVLVHASTMSILDAASGDVAIYNKGSDLVFTSSDITVYSKELMGKDEYQIDVIKTLVEDELPSCVKFTKADILPLLDRLALFVGQYDNDMIKLSFEEDGLKVSSKSISGFEAIKCVEYTNYIPQVCLINIAMLKTQIESLGSSLVELWYGSDTAIKLVDGDVMEILALGE